MSISPIIYGAPLSSYVRATRMTCVEKGIEHTLEPADTGSDEYRRNLHPYGKMPAMRHGEVSLFETSAIIRYIDEAFPGPKLQPDTAAGRARMEQWISAYNNYIYRPMVLEYVLPYFFASGPNGQPDRARIDQALPQLETQMELLNQAYGDSPWLAGDSVSLADLILAPALHTCSQFPEGREFVTRYSNVGRALQSWEQRDSVRYLKATPSAQ